MFGLTLGRMGAGPNYGNLGAAWTPAALFANDEEGVWFDPSDLSTMFQDSAGTTPVTADGQPVGLILDKSGRGNHASQATAAKRPLHKTDGTYHWLQFDGVDDSLVTPAIDLSGTNNISWFLGINKTNDGNPEFIFEVGDTAAVNGNISATQRGQSFEFSVYVGSNPYSKSTTLPSYPAPEKLVFSNVIETGAGSGASATEKMQLLINEAEPTTSIFGGINQAAFGNLPLYIGGRGGATYMFAGSIFPIVLVGSLCSAQEVLDSTMWVNSKTGAY